MRDISTENATALAARRLVARDFLWVVARNRDTGDPVPDGMWSDAGTKTVDVINPDSGSSEARTYYGAGTLVAISDIPLVANLTVQTVTIVLSQVHERVETLVRTYDCKQARVEIHRGLFDPSTRVLVAPAECRFVGFVDSIEIKTPTENEAGSVTLTCSSHTQEMTRSNPDTRSHESQLLRDATDTFYIDTAVVGSWEHFWGKTSGVVKTAEPKRRGKPLGVVGS